MSERPVPPVPPQRGDEHELFAKYADRLQRVTRVAVRTTPEIVDDACAFAWMKLVSNQPRRETAFAWLRAVARNEALRLDRLSQRELARQESFEHTTSVEERLPARRGRPEDAHQLMELRDRLEELSPRLREIVFLQAAGWRQSELAERLGVSDARVNQLLGTAKARMREMDLREMEPTSARGRLLRAIEEDPPRYIAASIGRQPRVNPKHGFQAARREWKRLVLEIEDYRAANAIKDRVLPLGRANDDFARDTLQRRIADFRRDRGLSMGIER